MSEWTSLAKNVLQDRYDLTSWNWSATAEDTYTGNALIEARVGLLLYPGQRAVIENPKGWFQKNAQVGTPIYGGNGIVYDPGLMPCMTFRTVPQAFGASALDITNNDWYIDPNRWFLKDWSITDLTLAGVDTRYGQYIDQARGTWLEVLRRIEWIPNEVAVKVDRAIGAGVMPTMIRTDLWTANYGPLPAWLESPYRQAAWNELCSLMGTLNRDVTVMNISLMQTEAKALAASSAFWNTVASLSGADLLDSKWRELMDGIRRYNVAVNTTRQSIERMKLITVKYPGAADPDQKMTITTLQVEIDGNVTQVRALVPESMLKILQQEGTNLGIAPVVLVAVGVAAIIAAAGVISIWVVEAEKTARKAMDLEHQLLMASEALAAEAFNREQEAILARQNELYALHDNGQIGPTEYNAEMAALNARAKEIGLELASRRAQNQTMAEAYSNDLNSLRASEVTGGIEQMKGMVMWGAIALGVIALTPMIWKRGFQK